MALFGKKEKEQAFCPICGKELKFFSSTILADGVTICDDCVATIRPLYEKEIVCSKIRNHATGRVMYDFSGQYHSTNRYQYAKNKERDPVVDLSLEEVKEAMDVLEAYNEWVRTEYGGKEPEAEDLARADAISEEAAAGSDVTAILKVRGSELLMLRPLDVGLKRAKELKGKTCVRGYVGEGSFAKGDQAILISGGTETQIELLDVYKGGIHDTIGELIAAGMQKHIANKNDFAFLLFDGGDALAMPDDIVIKREG